jgi:transcriptional repressor NrdR
VVDSRATSDGIRRRRICADCKRRFTTYERLAPPAIKVSKRDGRVEPFDAQKLTRVLQRVGGDRKALGIDAIERVARSIEASLLDQGIRSISSAGVIDMLLAKLRDLDRVAYDRLAADYLDEDGQLRVGSSGADEPADTEQLGLFEDEN